MACPKCNFYLPKHSSQVRLLEGKANLLQLRHEIPLSEAEVAAVDDGVAAMEELLEKLVDVPTPAGLTPLEIEIRTQGTARGGTGELSRLLSDAERLTVRFPESWSSTSLGT